MSMKEWACSGYLVDLSFSRGFTITNASEENIKRICTLFGDCMYDEFVEYANEWNKDIDFYEYADILYHEGDMNLVKFKEEDNPEDFEFNVLYLYVPEEDLYIKHETEYMKKLKELDVEPEFGNYGVWG